MSTSPVTSPSSRRNVFTRGLAVLGSFNIAVVVFALMIVVTFFGTWYQKKHGLYDCLRWYFESWYTPKEAWIWGWLPLPGMATLLAIVFVNVLAGGIIRIRKSKRTIGVVIAHCSVLGFIISGAVSLWTKTEGVMRVFEGQSSSMVQALYDSVVEVRELTGAKGEKPSSTRVQYFHEKLYRDCSGGRTRTFFSEGWPFELRVSGYVRNADIVPAGDPAITAESPRHGDYALRALPVSPQNELNAAGLHLSVVDSAGKPVTEGLLALTKPSPLVFETGGRRFSAELVRERWQTPFTVHLDDFRAIYYTGTGSAPGRRKPKEYESDIRVTHENGRESKHRISMNKPLRDAGYVAYQTSFDSESPPGRERWSAFTVVKNRSDQWPLYSLIVCTAGLLLHFGLKLAGFFRRSSSAAKSPPASVTL
jgi:hypothetical protein